MYLHFSQKGCVSTPFHTVTSSKCTPMLFLTRICHALTSLRVCDTIRSLAAGSRLTGGPHMGKYKPRCLFSKSRNFNIALKNRSFCDRKTFICTPNESLCCIRHLCSLQKHFWGFGSPQNDLKVQLLPKPGSVWILNFVWKSPFYEPNTLLRLPNELKPYFPVLFYMNISFLKFVCIYRPFRRLEKTSRAPISENHVFECNSRLRWAMVFLTADSESTQKVTSIATFLTSKHLFGESYKPNPVFGQNPVFAVREQQPIFRELSRPDSENSGSKVPWVKWNHVFFWFSKYTMWDTPFDFFFVILKWKTQHTR